jgi:hypothetical protein
MTAYLIANPPRRSQFRVGRRAQPSGAIVVHTAENTPDLLPPDDGAETVARFIVRRTDPGSYHQLVDSDSRIELVPFGYEAFHDGTGSNPWSIGLSVATTAALWPSKPAWWRDAAVSNLADAAVDAARWLRSVGAPVPPARRISKAESDARLPGFLAHGDRDPGRRSDPGRGFPWTQFLTLYEQRAQAAGLIPRPTATEDEAMDLWAYINDAYREAGRAPGSDGQGRRYWYRTALAAQGVARVDVLRTMEQLLGLKV